MRTQKTTVLIAKITRLSTHYTNTQHRAAYEQAVEMAAKLSGDELLDSLSNIANAIRRLPGMYHKRSLCERMARQAIEAEIAKRERVIYG